MKKYYVYILLCSDGLTYTGITNDITRRLNEHNGGSDTQCFTYKRRPVELIFVQDFTEAMQAIVFEKKIKKWSSKKKLALAEGKYDLLKILAECRNDTHAKNRVIEKRGLGCSARYFRTN